MEFATGKFHHDRFKLIIKGSLRPSAPQAGLSGNEVQIDAYMTISAQRLNHRTLVMIHEFIMKENTPANRKT